MISDFNLFKNNINTKHGRVLKNIIESVDKEVCFIGDETTYFFSQVRRVREPKISLTNKKIFNFLVLLSESEKIKHFFNMYHKAFDYLLVDHFEKDIYQSDDIIMCSYMLFCLLNLSDNHDDSLSNYNEDNLALLDEKVKKINNYYLSRSRILFNEYPDDSFIVSHEKKFDGEGILITKRQEDGNLFAKIDDFNYYYMEEK